MSQAASQAAAFYRDVARTRRVWTIRDDEGNPAPKTPGSAMPFWSSQARVGRNIATVPGYAGFRPEEISWEAFRDEWLPHLERDGLRIGVKWSGPRAVGYDLAPPGVRANVEAAMEHEGVMVTQCPGDPLEPGVAPT